jgi:hypothetical protein
MPEALQEAAESSGQIQAVHGATAHPWPAACNGLPAPPHHTTVPYNCVWQTPGTSIRAHLQSLCWLLLCHNTQSPSPPMQQGATLPYLSSTPSAQQLSVTGTLTVECLSLACS